MPDTFRLKRLLRYLKPYWQLEIVTFLTISALAVLTLAIPGAVQYMIDRLIPGITESGDWRPALYFGLTLIGIYFGHLVFSLLRDYLAGRIAANIVRDMRAELFEHLHRVSLRFYQQRQVGEIMSRLLADVQRIQSLLTTTLIMAAVNVLMLAGVLVYLLNINWLLTVIALVPVPLTILVSNVFGKKLHHISRRLQETFAALSARLQESLLGVRTARSFTQEAQEQQKTGSILERLTGIYVSNSVTTSFAVNLSHFVNMIGPVVVLAWGTYLVAGGSIKLGALIAFYILLAYLYQPIKDLATINVEYQSALASVNRLFEYLDEPIEVEPSQTSVSLSSLRGQIEYSNVVFSHEPTNPILRGINLSVQPGETVAIVGASGSGKSTILNLLMRFFEPESGRITIDGVELQNLPLSFLRSRIGLVEQEPLLFRATIHENIAYGRPDADRDRVIAAARAANCHEFIEKLPNGYDTVAGERGITLSGGERQRICLARAVLIDPDIFLLDEATSAVDSVSEQLIQRALREILQDKTAIIVAHRLSSTVHADRILLLENGRIAAQGSHDSLLTSSATYRHLVSAQLAG